MKFSIVIPLYNKQSSIRRAIYSVFDQTVDKTIQTEIIIVDDGSTDKSAEIVNELQRQHANREIIVYSQANAGVSAARNKGIDLASSDFIAFLDADDTYQPNFLSEIRALITRYPSAKMFATAYSFINSETGTKRTARIVGLNPRLQHQILDDYFYCAAYGDLPITSSSVCIDKSALKIIGGFPVGENMGEDQHVWAQIALRFSIAFSSTRGANYFEVSDNSLMQIIQPSCEIPFSKRLQQLLDLNLVPAEKRASVKQYIAGHLLDLVRRNLDLNKVDAAMNLLQDSRANALPKRYVYWCARVQIARLFGLFWSESKRNVQGAN